VISGRRRQDVRQRLGGADVCEVVGNHGLEPSGDMGPFERQIAAVRPQLEAALWAHREIEVEDKRYSLALHYRRAHDKALARRAIRAATSRLTIPMRFVPGKLVVNIVPRSAPHKGDSFIQLWTQEKTERAIFVGDDVTDEDVFRLGQPDHLLSVRVGQSRTSAALYYLRNQGEIDDLLSCLCELRSSSTPP
jgi:trehalose 6-phosphate phosphatase